ncbi:MAG: ankyrin repeat domain-containing protein [Planctomycetaceae bacterium]
MDARFHAAQAAIRADQPDRLEELLAAQPELLHLPSLDPRDHPNLLNCLVLETPPRRELPRLLRLFRDGGADLASALVAAASGDNRPAVEELLALGAPLDAPGGWSALDEALYWVHTDLVALLRERGASVRGLRGWAAVGDLAQVRACFDDKGELTEQAGELAWPFGRHPPGENLRDRGALMSNALGHACQWGQLEVARELVARGAEVNALVAGFDFNGTALHYAALHNHRGVCDWLLEQGADPTIRDGKVHKFPDDWATHGGHHELSAHLAGIRHRHGR